MSTQEHYYKANAHDLRFWSRVQDELIQFCHEVDVYINRLRRKIDDFHEVKLLQTVRGVGYILKGPGSEKCELYDIAIDLDRIVEMAPADSRLMSPHQVASQLVYRLFI